MTRHTLGDGEAHHDLSSNLRSFHSLSFQEVTSEDYSSWCDFFWKKNLTFSFNDWKNSNIEMDQQFKTEQPAMDHGTTSMANATWDDVATPKQSLPVFDATDGSIKDTLFDTHTKGIYKNKSHIEESNWWDPRPLPENYRHVQNTGSVARPFTCVAVQELQGSDNPSSFEGAFDCSSATAAKRQGGEEWSSSLQEVLRNDNALTYRHDNVSNLATHHPTAVKELTADQAFPAKSLNTLPVLDVHNVDQSQQHQQQNVLAPYRHQQDRNFLCDPTSSRHDSLDSTRNTMDTKLMPLLPLQTYAEAEVVVDGHAMTANAETYDSSTRHLNLSANDSSGTATANMDHRNDSSSNVVTSEEEDNDDATMADSVAQIQPHQNKKWMGRYKALVQYREKFGNCNVPFQTTFHKNIGSKTKQQQEQHKKMVTLSKWVKRQRHQYKLRASGKHSHLTDERVQLLEDIGFIWDSHDAAWEENYEGLLEFHRKNGHCHVPVAEARLSTWMKRQRRQYKLFIAGKPSTMTQTRIDKLNKLGFVWYGSCNHCSAAILSCKATTAACTNGVSECATRTLV